MIANILAVAMAAAQAAPVAADIGPEPAMEEFIALAESELLTKVRDPRGVTFEWPYRLVAGRAGFYTCGKVTTDRGRAPREGIWVSAVVTNGRVVSAQWSTSNGMLAWDCKRNVRSGNLVAR